MVDRHSALHHCHSLDLKQFVVTLLLMSADAAVQASGPFLHPFGLSTSHLQYCIIYQPIFGLQFILACSHCRLGGYLQRFSITTIY